MDNEENVELIRAIKENNIELVKSLLDNGTDVTALGDAPIFMAIHHKCGDKMLDLLFSKGATIYGKNIHSLLFEVITHPSSFK